MTMRQGTPSYVSWVEPRHTQVQSQATHDLSVEVDKVTWPLHRLRRLRDERLRSLLRYAKEHSPWHAKRLAHVDPERVSGDDLSLIPPMTKTDLMDHWDEIVTDQGLTLDAVQEHLVGAIQTQVPALLHGRYIGVRTGGTTGSSAVIAWDLDAFRQAVMANLRHVAWQEHRLRRKIKRIAMITACNPSHTSAVIGWLLGRANSEVEVIAPTSPIAEIVTRLNAYQPDAIAGYSSVLVLLAAEARAGRLLVDLVGLEASGEPINDFDLAAIESAFKAPVFHGYGATETGPMAVSNPPAHDLHLFEDTVVYEPVDVDHRPTPVGCVSNAVLVTNVVNQLLPLIRYEIGDRVLMAAGPNPGPFPGRRIAKIIGRATEEFEYADKVRVSLSFLEPVLLSARGLLQYQVRQTSTGIQVMTVDDGGLDGAELAEGLQRRLQAAGLGRPTVELIEASNLPRDPETGKLRRFVPAEPEIGPDLTR